MADSLTEKLLLALAARTPLFDERHASAFRLFNGFVEGNADLIVDLYGRTLLLHNYARPSREGVEGIAAARAFFLGRLPWIEAVVVKARHGDTPEARRGELVFGTSLVTEVREAGLRYAVDPLLNRDAGLYLDTRLLRGWLLEETDGLAVLNAFAYTGSLGVAALGGGAARVVQLDRSRRFLNQAKRSYTLNGFPIRKEDFLAADFWPAVARLKRKGARFEMVIVDPPIFSDTKGGRVDLARDPIRLINKVRPLVRDGGRIVAINNALFVSGKDYLGSLRALEGDGYVTIEALVPVGEDFTGYPATRIGAFPVDPHPFNHPTKIAILRIHHRDSGPTRAPSGGQFPQLLR